MTILECGRTAGLSTAASQADLSKQPPVKEELLFIENLALCGTSPIKCDAIGKDFLRTLKNVSTPNILTVVKM